MFVPTDNNLPQSFPNASLKKKNNPQKTITPFSLAGVQQMTVLLKQTQSPKGHFCLASFRRAAAISPVTDDPVARNPPQRKAPFSINTVCRGNVSGKRKPCTSWLSCFDSIAVQERAKPRHRSRRPKRAVQVSNYFLTHYHAEATAGVRDLNP